ncbi:hypothetical protein D3C72_2289970 [compost metagenome]
MHLLDVPAGNTVDLVQTKQLPPKLQQRPHGIRPFKPQRPLGRQSTHLKGTEDQQHLVGTAARPGGLLKHRFAYFAVQLAGLDDAPHPAAHFRRLPLKIPGP